MKISLLAFAFCLSSVSFSQAVDYNDVAVIVNDNSQTSVDIGNYFQAARNIPNINMIHINAPITEAIDSTQFEAIRAQIEAYLLNNNLADSINYLVTTKGVPLKIEASCFDTIPGPTYIKCASFDSELCLILSPNAFAIGQSGSSFNPIYESFQHFSHQATGIYLVTRLTGYVKQDVFNLIDRSGFQTGINKLSAQAILDLNNATGGDSTYFHDFYITPGNDYLVANSWDSQVDLNFNPIINQDNVFAYIHYSYGLISNVNLNYEWTKGSVGAMATTNTAETFDPLQNWTGKFLLADLIADGCTGGMGYINPNFYGAILRPDLLFDRFLNVTEDYNLAESFYMAERFLSWQTVIVGDPKASVVIDNTASIDEPEELNLRLYPNPTHGNLTIESDEVISSIQIYGINGALVKSIETNSSSKVDLDLNDLNGGVYLAHIYVDDKVSVERIVLTK